MAVDPAVAGITGMRQSASFAMARDTHCGSLTGTRTRGSAIGASGETALRHDSIEALVQERTRTLKE